MRAIRSFMYRFNDGNLADDIAFDVAAMFLGHLHEASLPEHLEKECAKMLIVHLNENMLSEDMTLDIAFMFMTYLDKANLSNESINELIDEADKILIATAIQKFIMRPVTAPWIRRRTEGESTESTDAKPGNLRSWRREIRPLEVQFVI